MNPGQHRRGLALPGQFKLCFDTGVFHPLDLQLYEILPFKRIRLLGDAAVKASTNRLTLNVHNDQVARVERID